MRRHGTADEGDGYIRLGRDEVDEHKGERELLLRLELLDSRRKSNDGQPTCEHRAKSEPLDPLGHRAKHADDPNEQIRLGDEENPAEAEEYGRVRLIEEIEPDRAHREEEGHLDRPSPFPCEIKEGDDCEEGRDGHDGKRDRVDRDNQRIGGYHIYAVVGLVTELPLTLA